MYGAFSSPVVSYEQVEETIDDNIKKTLVFWISFKH